MSGRLAALVAIAVAGAAALTAAQAPPQAPPVFRGGTDLIEVDVVVRDRNGAFIPDLSAEEFVIETAGRPQPIQQFFVRTSAASGAAAPPPLFPGASTPAPAPRVFVVIFDDEHLTQGGLFRTQQAARTLFEKQFRHGDVGGVVVGGRVVNGRLTTDREELLKAVKEAKPSSGRASRHFDEREWPRLTEVEAVRIAFNADRVALDEAKRRACMDRPEDCNRIDPEPFVRSKAAEMSDAVRAESARTLQMLVTLTTGLAKFPGRKTILLMSEGFIAEEQWPLVADAVGLAARANARIYSLDARGLDRNFRSVFDVTPGNDSNARLLEQMDFGADSMNSLAVDTGGFVVRNTNQFDRAIERIADDAANYYVIGMRPVEADGKFHPLKVTVKRSGVSVRARRGYVAAPPAPLTQVQTAAAPHAAIAPAADAVEPAEPSANVATAEPEAEAVSVDGRIVAQSKSANGIRVRPDAAAHADALAGATTVRDADATAGWEAYQRGDVETARERLASAAARNGSDAWVSYTLGMSNYALRRFREAGGAWERVRAAAPEFEPVYFDLIDAYLQQKEHDQAIRIARAGLERWPFDAELHNALGVVHTTRGSLDDAVKAFQAAVTAAPTDSTGYFNLGKALELRYFRSRHYVKQLGKWMANDSDRTNAVDNYQRYIEMSGPYTDAARAGLTRLNWIAK